MYFIKSFALIMTVFQLTWRNLKIWFGSVLVCGVSPDVMFRLRSFRACSRRLFHCGARQPWSGARAAPDVLCWRTAVRCVGPEQSQAVREPCELCYCTAVEVSKRASTHAPDNRAGPDSPSVLTLREFWLKTRSASWMTLQWWMCFMLCSGTERKYEGQRKALFQKLTRYYFNVL